MNLLNKEFTLYGRNIGRIVADLFYVNPMEIFNNDLWTTSKSSVIIGAGTSHKIHSEFYMSLDPDGGLEV